MRKHKGKILSAGILAMVMAVIVLFPNIRDVFGNPQAAIGDITITMPMPLNPADDMYNFIFEFTRPPAPPPNQRPVFNPPPTQGVAPPGGGTPGPSHIWGESADRAGDGSAFFYRFQQSAPNFINSFPAPAEIINSFGGVGTGDDAVPIQEISVERVNLNLAPGSVHAFRFQPFHRVLNHVWVPPTATADGFWRADQSDHDGPWSTVLFLSDISVTAVPHEGGYRVTWDSPLVGGVPIFPMWQLAFKPAGDHTTFDNFPNNRTVPISESQLVREGNRVTYHLQHPNLRILTAYDIKVEPMLGTGLPPFREAAALSPQLPRFQNVTIGGQTFRMFFTPLGTNLTDNAYWTRADMLDVDLEVDAVDAFNIRLSWPSLAGAEPPITRVTILMGSRQDLENFRADPGRNLSLFPNISVLGTIEGAGNVANIRTHTTDRPTLVTHYMLMFDPGGFSSIAFFDPFITEFQPTAPFIRNFSRDGDAEPPLLTVTWDAFIRDPLTDLEREFLISSPIYRLNNMFHDENVEYDIFITDDLNFLDIMTAEPIDMRWGQQSWRPREHLTGNFDPIEFTYTIRGITHYISSATGLPAPVTDNKLYYIKIVARQIDSEGNLTGADENEARAATFVAATNLLTRPPMISRPPFRVLTIPRDDWDGCEHCTMAGQQCIGDHHIGVEWDLRYFEAYCARRHYWYTRIAWSIPEARFIFDDDILPAPGLVVIDLTTLPDFTADMGPTGVYSRIIERIRQFAPDFHITDPGELSTILPLRLIDFTDPAPPADFALLWVRYDYLLNAFPDLRPDQLMQAYVDEHLRPLISEGRWPSGSLGEIGIVPVPRGQMKGNNTMFHIAEDLEPHTTYLFALWPYLDVDLWNFIAYEPANIILTTTSYHPAVDITPDVPILDPIEEGDLWLRVGWFFQDVPHLYYTLYFSELASDHPHSPQAPSPITITNEEIHDPWNRDWIRWDIRFNPLTGQDEPYVEFTIHDLFPETIYHIWIRAHAENPSGLHRSSDFSNYITMRTLPLQPPPPPTGFGLVGRNNLNIMNTLRGVQEGPFDIDFITYEWNVINAHYAQRRRDRPDDWNDSRVITVAPPAEIVTNPPGFGLEAPQWESLSTYIAKITDLAPNRAYYARVKTVLTVSRASPINVEYQYVLQVSETEDFFSFIEIIIPGPGRIADVPGQRISRESEWTETIRISTDTWTGEYDGDIDPNTFPLPEDDFEWIYCRDTQTLTYRFRSVQVDQYGNRDNMVDQRFISWLIDSRIYNFTVHFGAHPFGDVPISRRVMSIPFSVYSAMADRFISITAIMEDTTFDFQAQFLNMPEVWRMTGYGYGTYIEIISEENPHDAPTINTEISAFAAMPARLGIRITAGVNVLNLDRTILDFEIRQRVDDHTLLNEGNIAGYMATFATQLWNRGEYTVNRGARFVSQRTAEIGTYSAITFFTPISVTPDLDAIAVLERVSRHVVFVDMPFYYSGADVSSTQLSKLVAAIASGNPTVAINADLTSDELHNLSRGGLMPPMSDAITRQEAINILVRLYELKIGMPIREYTPLHLQTLFFDIAAADPQFQTGLLKAAELGFFENVPNSVRPRETITLGEVLRIVDLIIDFAGL